MLRLDEDNDRILSWSDSAPVSAESVLLRYEEIRAQFRSALNAAMLRVLELEEDGPMLRALQAIDRYDFMPHHSKAWGYCDSPVPITYNMTESALHAVIMTLNAVLPQKGERVLVCGAKGGYLMALAGELVGPKGLVVGIDWQDEIVEHVQSCLDLYPEQLAHVSVERSEDVTIGLEHRKPWDVIIMNGSIPQIPTDVIHQLRDENGRLLFFFADGTDSSTCQVVRRNQDILKEESLSRFRFTSLVGRYGFGSLERLHAPAGSQ